MVDELIKKLLEAGVHFGHQTHRWNPKMKRYIFGKRSGIYIIDLEKTVECLNRARDFLKDLTAKGGVVLYIGTKKQSQTIIEEEAKRSGMFYVHYRWPGGLLTNFQTIRKSLERLKIIEQMSQDGIWQNLTKKEAAHLTKEKDKLLRDLGGIREMKGHPDAVIIVDPKNEEIAVHEANRLKIPIVGLIDTNCDPDVIDYPIPGNDDALKSIRFIVSLLTDSIVEGRQEFMKNEAIKKRVEEDSAPADGGQQAASDKESSAVNSG